MGATVATRVDPFPHVTKGRVIVAVGAEDITLALGSGSEVQDLESVKGTLKRQTIFKCFTYFDKELVSIKTYCADSLLHVYIYVFI